MSTTEKLVMNDPVCEVKIKRMIDRIKNENIVREMDRSIERKIDK